MQKIWKIKNTPDIKVINHLSKILNVDKIIASLLAQRGIYDFDSAKNFFRPDLNNLHDPFLMKDMRIAVKRLSEAIKNNQKILIYGDYDVDGTTAVSLVYSFLRKFHKNIDYYIPDRYTEGYGISFKGVDYACEKKCSLVIALDCGIKAIDKIDYANKKNIDFIICDHHTPGDKLPEALAVLDPKRKDCKYPYKELSGCGVGYKFMQAFCLENNIDTQNLNEFLDLVAISIASDIVPITGENRILAYHGLKKLNENPITGIAAIKKTAGIEKKDISISDCVFKIGPRINAAGRIHSGRYAVDLMVAQDETLAAEFGDLIDDYNIQRKNLDKNITSQAIEIITSSPKLQKKKTTVLYNPQWHKGVIGIVASRLIENYYRPTIILTESKGKITGSARSVEGFDLYEAIDKCSHLLIGFGGHKYAAGLTLEHNKLHDFEECFENVVRQSITNEQLTPKVDIDIELEFKDITEKFFRILKQFAPFGPGNMSPVFVTKNVRDNGFGRIIGNDNNHLKLEIIDKNNIHFTAIAFSMGKYYDKISKKIPFDIAYSINENEFNGKKYIQLFIKDIKFKDDE